VNRPAWVEVGLFGINDRASAMSWCVSCLIGSVLLFLLTVIVMRKFLDAPVMVSLIGGAMVGGLFSLSALWYWLCIKWMDNNRGWSQTRRRHY
jgi:hypothetical protein